MKDKMIKEVEPEWWCRCEETHEARKSNVVTRSSCSRKARRQP